VQTVIRKENLNNKTFFSKSSLNEINSKSNKNSIKDEKIKRKLIIFE